MQASLLRERIRIMTPVLSVNEYGEQVQEYETLYQTKARVIHDFGGREVTNNEVFNNYQKTFHVRRYIQVDEKMLIRYNKRDYRILTIEDVPSNNMKIIKGELINE